MRASDAFYERDRSISELKRGYLAEIERLRAALEEVVSSKNHEHAIGIAASLLFTKER